jgi:biopolymer transport protein ExbB
MSFDLMHIWASMSIANKAITLALLLMGVFAVAITVERMLALSKSARVSRRFADEVNPRLADWDPEGLVAVAARHQASTLARIFAATTKRFLQGAARPEGGLSPVDMARNEAVRQQEIAAAELRRGMGALATIGSITPFVGLLGTVIGIIAAFQAIGAAGAGGIGTVSVGIAEALIETALGLAVAIPAVIFFNYLSNRVAAIESALGRSTGQLIDEMEYRHGKRGAEQEDRISDVHETREAA